MSTLLVPGQRRLIQSSSDPDSLKPAQNEQVAQAAKSESSPQGPANETETDQAFRNPRPYGWEGVKQKLLGLGRQVKEDSSFANPRMDPSWVFAFTGDRIGAIDPVNSEEMEEFVTRDSGAKMLCSWSLDSGEEAAIWVPGKPSSQHAQSWKLRFGDRTDAYAISKAMRQEYTIWKSPWISRSSKT